MRLRTPALGLALFSAVAVASVQAAPAPMPLQQPTSPVRSVAQAAGSENVSNTSSQSEGPQAAAYGASLRVVWGERDNNAVFASEKNVGSGWPGATKFEDGTKTAQQLPDIAVSANGTTHAAYAAGNRIYYRSKPNGGAWSGKILVAEDNFPNPVRIAAASDSTIWVIWRDADGTKLRWQRSTNAGQSWGEGGTVAQQNGNMFAPDVAVDGAGVPHVVWYLRNGDVNGNTARYADWNGSGWNVGTIGGSGDYVADPVIVVGPDNAQHVAYRRQAGDNWIIQYVARAPGQGWGGQTNVRTTNGNAGYAPAIAADAGGGVHVTWSELTGSGGRDVLYSVRRPGQSFGGVTNVSENGNGWNSRSAIVVTGDAANPVAHVFYQRGVRGQDVDEVYYRSIGAAAPAPQPTPQPTPVPQPTPAPLPGDARVFPETGQYISGRIRQYWEGNGGLAIFGLPLNAEASRQTLDGTFHMQLFERERLELHPENGAPYDVLLGRLGGDILYQQGRPWETQPREQPQAGCQYFAETQHNVCDPFLSYWRNNGLEFGDGGVTFRESLALFGLPLTTPRVETNRDGDTVLTQWFERARFEYHPNNPDPYKVLLGRLGAESGQR